MIQAACGLHGDGFVASSGSTGRDIYFSAAGAKKFDFAVECKNQESLNIWRAILQAKNHVGESDDTPLVIFSKNREEIYCALPLSRLLSLLSVIEHLKPLNH